MEIYNHRIKTCAT